VKTTFRIFAGLLGFLPMSGPCLAQVTTGTPPFGSFGGGPDVVNLANLNDHIAIPVMKKAGRGIPFTYVLSYDTSVWYPVGASGSQVWTPVGNWGWRGQTESSAGYLSFKTTVSVCHTTCNPRFGCYPDGWLTTLSNYVYHDYWGVPHPFAGSTWSQSSTCGGGSGGSIGPTATDGSGYTISGNTITSRGGTAINPPINTTSGSGSFTDRNGNQITINSSGVFTDTLGTTALTIAGSVPSPVTFSYTPPAGGSVSYTMKYSSYTVQTNFACSGITDYGPTSNVSLVSEVDLPDISVNPNDKYTFTYEATPGHAGNVTGRLASVTLPTGGIISFSYSGGSNGITCADGTTATLTRTTPDGTWTYAHSESGTAWTTTVTDPTTQQNQTVLNFQGIYETERQVYQGSSTSGTLLKTTTTCYNGNTSNCNTTAITLPITQKSVTIQLGTNGVQCKHVDSYNSYGMLTEQDDYDYGSGGPGSLIRKKLITYAALGNINAFRQTVTIQDGGAHTVSQTAFNYDETGAVATTGTPQHVSVTGSRGNLTSVVYSTHGSATLKRSFTNFDTGNVQTATDVNGAVTTYTYGTGSCGNSFATSISLPLNLSESVAWNCTGGVKTSATDVNGQTTTAAYNDPYFWRPASVTDPTNAAVNLSYISSTQLEASLNFNAGNSTSDVVATADGLGRPHVGQIRQAPGGSNFDSIETDYDAHGRESRVTLPYTQTEGQTNPSGPGITTTYDALGRRTQVSDSGGGYTSYSYTQNDTVATRGPAPSGENTKRRQLEYDSIDRLTSVCEITSATGSGACSQTSPQTGYWTKYTYDAGARLTGVTQNAQSTGATQTRTYVYDLMGRMTSETNAESGTTTYTYDGDATCGTSAGDLVKRVDAVGNTTCYAYDALHRQTSVTYPSGSYASSTPSKYFAYDSATVNGQAMANGKGRLVEAYTCVSSCSSKITDVGFSYTVRGQVSDVYESTPHSGGYYHVNALYWETGMPKQLSGLPSVPTITYSPDGEGRPSAVSASSGQNPVSSTVYNSASLPTTINFGSGESDAFQYDANTNRMSQYQFNVNGQAVTGALTWNQNTSAQKLVVTDAFNSSDSQTCTYSHDDLSRLSSANCGSVWSQTFGYDAFGNITKSGSSSFQPTYSSSTNRMVTLPGFTPTYDANGNVLTDSLHTYAWDSAGRPVTIDSVSLTYDALGRMVEQNRSGTYTQIVYASRAHKLALYNGQTLQKAIVPLGGNATVTYNGAGLLYYGHPDWLGHLRFGSTSSRTMYFDGAYAPYSETYAQAGTFDPAFTGQRQDTVGGLYDFATREFSIQGRWPSPDPAGLAAVNLTDPQSLNRYAYVRNSPLTLTDPLGMEDCDPEAGPCCNDPNDPSCGSGDGQGSNTCKDNAGNAMPGCSYDPNTPCVDAGGNVQPCTPADYTPQVDVVNSPYPDTGGLTDAQVAIGQQIYGEGTYGADASMIVVGTEFAIAAGIVAGPTVGPAVSRAQLVTGSVITGTLGTEAIPNIIDFGRGLTPGAGVPLTPGGVLGWAVRNIYNLF
jgi:RHS repeat-associated protein